MTVRELIEELQKHNPHLSVMFLDYENGETDIVDIKEMYFGYGPSKQLVVVLSD